MRNTDQLNIKFKEQKNDPLLTPNEHNHSIGKNPLDVDVNLLKDAGHKQTPLAKIIRKKCLNCCGFQAGEVSKCVSVSCPLWPYRMGKSPFRSYQAKASKREVSK